ncbi:MAG: PaaI family thioesterase [Henriciella sp.]
MSDDLTQNLSQAAAAGFEPLPWHKGFGRQVGPLFEKRGNGPPVRAFEVAEHHINGMTNAHGGMLMTFADMSWGAAVAQSDETWWVTVRLVCDFLSGAELGDWVVGRGDVISSIDNLHTVTGRIWTNDRVIMTGSGVFKTIKRREQNG